MKKPYSVFKSVDNNTIIYIFVEVKKNLQICIIIFSQGRKMRNYGEELRYQRKKRNKTLKQVESETGISNANLSRWESGKVLPNIDFCVILADYYGIPLDELIGREI